jgi:hypothetical protein
MAEFIVNQDVETETPTVEVTISPNNPLRLGRHRFRLIVVDDSGNKSIPDEVVVIVADQEAPTAVLRGPGTVPFEESFSLDGRRSIDAGGGRITTWVWTYLGPTDG